MKKRESLEKEKESRKRERECLERERESLEKERDRERGLMGNEHETERSIDTQKER